MNVPDDATVHDEIEVSKHMHVTPFGVDEPMTEWEVQTGLDDTHYVSEAAAKRVKQNLGLDLESDDYRAGGEVIVVSESEADHDD